MECVFCDRTPLREAEVYFENEFCACGSSHDPGNGRAKSLGS